jgi:hypothetical protein
MDEPSGSDTRLGASVSGNGPGDQASFETDRTPRGVKAATTALKNDNVAAVEANKTLRNPKIPVAIQAASFKSQSSFSGRNAGHLHRPDWDIRLMKVAA